jgi:hypothetical protein
MDDMASIFQLLDEDKIQSAIDKIKAKLNEKQDSAEFIEQLINNLNRLSAKSNLIMRTLFPELIKLISIDNDVLRYSLVLSLKSVCESEPALLLPYSRDLLMSKNANAREGILQLLTFAAGTNPDEVKSFMGDAINMLQDEKDFVQNRAVSLLKVLGNKFSIDIEKKLVSFAQDTNNIAVRTNVEKVLKELVDLKKLEQGDFEKKQIEVQKKELDEKEKTVSQTEVKMKEESLQNKEIELQKKEVLKEKEKELIAKELALKERDLQLKEAKLLVEEKEKEIEEQKIRQKVVLLEKEQEMQQKQVELEKVKKELELKEIEKKKNAIIEEEQKRIDERLENMENQDKQDQDDVKEIKLDKD